MVLFSCYLCSVDHEDLIRFLEHDTNGHEISGSVYKKKVMAILERKCSICGSNAACYTMVPKSPKKVRKWELKTAHLDMKKKDARCNQCLKLMLLQPGLKPTTQTHQVLTLLETVSSSDIEELVSSLKYFPADTRLQCFEILNAALENKKKELANSLLDAYSSVYRDYKTPANTSLYYAVKLGDASLVKKLLEIEAALTAPDSDTNSPLHLAFELERYDLVDMILTAIQETLFYDDVSNKHGLTHLHIACARGNAQVAHDFEYTGSNIKCTVSKNSPTYPNYTCLRFACESKSLATIEVVVKATDPLGSCANDTADEFVAQKGQRGFVRLAIKTNHEGFSFGEDRKTRLNDFQQACFHGRVDSVKSHLKSEKDVNGAMSLEAEACPLFTPLHFALEADENRQQVVELLLEHGADVTLKNGLGMTPLHTALYNDHFREGKGSYDKIPKQDDTLSVVYAAVKDKEANPMDGFGLTYFHAAVAMNDLEAVSKFIERGEGVYQPIIPNCRNFAKYTPLHFAVKYGHEDMAQLLIHQSADVNANDDGKQFDTPIQTAIEYGQCKMVELLLANGANAKIKTYKKNETLLHLLVERFGDYDDEKDGLLHLVEILVKRGVDVDAKDHKLYTALHKSCSKFAGKRDIVYELLKWGADVNLKNCRGETALELASRSENQLEPVDYLNLYNHVQKLKDLGLKVEAKNEKFCEMVMEKRNEWIKSENWQAIEKMCNDQALACNHQERLAEVERLKKDLLDDKISLYDYLRMDVKPASANVENERIKEVINSKEYESYGYMVSAMYHKTLQYLTAQNLNHHENVGGFPVYPAVVENVIVRRVNYAPTSSSNKTSEQPVPANASLHDAVKLEILQWVKPLLAKESLLDVDSNKNSALHLAFILKQEEIVDLFLDYLKDSPTCLNLKNNHGLTYLHIAASRGNTALVEKLLKTRTDVTETVNRDSPMYPSYTALQFACDSKALDTMKVLLDAMNLFDTSNDGASNDAVAKLASKLTQELNMSQIDGELSAFHQTCSTGSAEEVLEFLGPNKDVNAPARREIKFTPLYTALHYAVESQCDRQKKVELLLKHGADVGLRNGLGMTPLHLAFYSTVAKDKIAELFEEREEYETVKVLYEATRNKEENLMDAFGLTYFHVAVAMNDLLLVKRILFRGEDVNRAVLPNPRGFSRCTPLHFAAEFGHDEMAKLLVARGANVNANEDNPRLDTPLQVSIVRGHYLVMDALLRHGANANVVREYGSTSTIHLIAERFRDIRKFEDSEEKLGLASFVEKLVKLGVDVDAKDSSGFTALYSACLMMCGSYDLIDSLLLAGADVNVKNKKGETAFDAASWSKVQGNYDDFLKLYNHVQRLKDLGLEVDPSAKKFCNTVMKRKEFWKKKDDWGFFEKMYSKAAMAKKKRERQEEIERLKEDMLTECVSLYDYLRMDANEAVAYVNNERIQWIIQDDEPRELYEIYGYLVPVVYRKSLQWLANEE